MRPLFFINIDQDQNAPGNLRLTAFKKIYKERGHEIVGIDPPGSLFNFARQIYQKPKRGLWISMPPFCNWIILLLPLVNKTLDIRDGWSIAMKSGYGGTAPSSPLKAKLAQCMEILAFLLANRVIVCTPGLQKYYQSFIPHFLSKKLVLIPNGFEQAHRSSRKPLPSTDTLQCICAGKFSEYGRNHVEKALLKLHERYPNREVALTLVGADAQSNNWIQDFINHHKMNINLVALSRKSSEELDRLLEKMDLGLAIVRNPEYELGTKAFLYISHGIPIFNYFDSSNPFTDFFSGYLDTDDGDHQPISNLSRKNQILQSLRRD